MSTKPQGILCLRREFTQIQPSPEKRNRAVRAAHYVLLSPHEWEWTNEQQADMARYVLWASQRLEAMQQIANGDPIIHESDEED